MINKDNCAGRNVECLVVVVLLQISFRFWQWKKVWKKINIWWSYKAYKKCQIFGHPVFSVASVIQRKSHFSSQIFRPTCPYSGGML